jgi:excisionase family DNA binding protein
MSGTVRDGALPIHQDVTAPPSTSTSEADNDILSGLSAVLTPEQVAEALNLSKQTIRQMCREGLLPCFKCGAQWRIPKMWLCDFMRGGGK